MHPQGRTASAAVESTLRLGEPSLLKRLWPPEQATCIDIASKSTGWNATKIVNAPGIRAIVKSRPPRPMGIRITARRRRTIQRDLVLLDGRARQRSGCGPCGCAE